MQRSEVIRRLVEIGLKGEGEMKRDILSEFEKRASRPMSSAKRTALAELLLAQSAGQIVFSRGPARG